MGPCGQRVQGVVKELQWYSVRTAHLPLSSSTTASSVASPGTRAMLTLIRMERKGNNIYLFGIFLHRPSPWPGLSKMFLFWKCREKGRLSLQLSVVSHWMPAEREEPLVNGDYSRHSWSLVWGLCLSLELSTGRTDTPMMPTPGHVWLTHGQTKQSKQENHFKKKTKNNTTTPKPKRTTSMSL